MEKNNPRKLDILLVLGSSRWGGGEKNCIDILMGLRNEFNFHLIHSPGTEIRNKLKDLNLVSHEFPLHLTPSPKRLNDFIKLVRQLRPSMIHSHLNRAQVYLSLSKPLLRVPWISTVHGFTSQIYNLLPDHLICVSKAIQDDLPFFLRKKSHLIYNGIESITEKMIVKNYSIKISSTINRPKALILATIHPNKGQLFVCRALENHDPQVEINLVGTGNKEHVEELSHKIAKNPNIRFLNQLSRTADQFYNEADFVIVPSYREALSYVAMEGLALEIPVLASRTGGLCEIIDEGINGLFFEPGNIDSFKKSLQQMRLNFQTYKQNLQAKPFLSTRPYFRIETMLKNVKSLYLQILEKKLAP